MGFEERGFPVVLNDVGQAVDAEKSEGEAGGEERVDEAGCRWEERPACACDGGAAEPEARDVAEGLDCFCGGELIAQGRDAVEDPVPGGGSFGEVPSCCRFVCCRDACAGDAVVELEDPDPSAVEDVVDCGVVRRVGRLIVFGGGAIERRFDPTYSGEVTVEGLGRGEVGERAFFEIECAMQETAWARGIDDELCGEREGVTVACGCEVYFGVGLGDVGDGGFVEVVDAEALCFADEEVVEVGAVPVGVGDGVVGAGGYEELVGAIGREWCGVVEVVMVEGKAALEAAGYFGVGLLPGAPLREWFERGEIVAGGEVFEEEIGEWCGGFADDHAGVFASFDEDDGAPEAAGDHG